MSSSPSSKLPIPDSYLVPGTRLYAGEYPGDKYGDVAATRLAKFLSAGIDTFIDLTESSENLEPYSEPLANVAGNKDVVRHNFPIRDVSITDETGMLRILDAIDAELARGRSVYVHCWGGIGRTGSVVGCWLVRQGATPSDALANVDRLFRSMSPAKVARHPSGSPETKQQRDFVLGWDEVEQRRSENSLSLRSRARGCLLGGAIGDALGAPVEFLSWDRIRARFGERGIEDYAPAYGRLGAITDDTQMTLWTAEGVIRGVARAAERGVGSPMSIIPRSYLRWLYTQDEELPRGTEFPELIIGGTADDGSAISAGWLFGVKELHSQRVPGLTCLSSLRKPSAALWERAPNESKGCGGVMRVAPLALIPGASIEACFVEACRAAAVTHGHSTGILSSGAMVCILFSLRDGARLEDAVHSAIEHVSREPESGETIEALNAALALWRSETEPTPERIESLGGGWTGETALSIGVYAALVAGRDFDRGIKLAVNHSGDSDSTGSICGQLIGIQIGVEKISASWLEPLELREVIETVADDLVRGPGESGEWRERYPAW